MYVAREHEGGIRLTIDGVHFFKDSIIKNIIELSEEHMKQWMSGENLEIAAGKGFAILKHGDDLLGCGKSSGSVILNSVPKERRVKNYPR